MEAGGGGGWRPPQGDPNMNPDGAASTEWRSQLQSEARSRIVTKIMDTLKKHLPISGPEGLGELKKIAVRFEEKIFSGATSQADYLRKISMKMLSMEQKTHAGNGAANALATGSNIVNQNSPDAVNMIQSQARNQGSQMTIQMSNQTQPKPQLLNQNLQNNLAKAQSDASALTSMTGLPHSAMANAGQNSNVQTMPGISQNSLANSGQNVAPNMYGNSQRPMQARPLQQQMISTAQQQQSQNQLVYQQQQQQHQQQQLLKQKLPHPSLLQSQMPQQQKQPLLQQANQLQSSQQPLMQMASNLQPNQVTLQHQQSSMIQPVPQSGLQQNQQNSIQQPAPSLYQSQSVVRQQPQPSSLQPQTSSLLQQPSALTQQPVLPSQQQQMLGNQAGIANLQPRQVHSQQNTVQDLQQQQQHQRLQNQQNNLLGMQHQMLNQQNMSLQHQQQLIAQTGISGLQQQTQQQSQQQQQHHQNQLLGSQTNVSNLQQHQHSMNMLQQPKPSGQQLQQAPTSLLQSQGQSQSQAIQQPHMALQSQPTQVQQQMSMQQQSNSLQQRLQASASVDSANQNAQTGVDLQEEAYQKIKSLKELYFTELNEMHQKITLRLQQNEALLLPTKQSEHLENLKKIKMMLERSLHLLQLPKSGIQPSLIDKLPMYEKQIGNLLNTHRAKRNVPSQPQQIQQPNMHSQPTSQQSQSQIGQMQQPENHMNQLQQINLQSSVTPVQPTTTSSMQSGPVSTTGQLGGPLSQQSMTNTLQPCSNLDSSQGNAMSSSQQSSVTSVGSLLQAGNGHVHQNAINAQQQGGINTSMPNNMNSMQPIGNPMQQNPNVLQQQIKQEQQQQLMQAHHMKQHLQQRQLQQQFLQQQMMQQQKPHILHQQQQQQQPPQPQSSQMQQHIQQRQQQQQQQQHQLKQQQSSQAQSHQVAQITQINEINDLKMRQVPGMKPGLYQSAYPTNKVQAYYQSQLKSGSSFPISSPQSLQAASPLVSQHSPQVDQQVLSTLPKAGTPIQSATPPFVVPSPSTPLAPSPLPGDHEKQLPGISSLSNVGSGAHHQSGGAHAQTQSIAVGTPGMSASPLLAEFTSVDAYQNNATAAPGKASTKERPLERLKKAVQSSSPTVLSSSINDIGSVVTMVDRIAGSAPGNGSRAAVGEDLVAMTKCRLQARTFMNQDTGATAKKMKRQISSMPLNAISSLDSGNDSFKQLGPHDVSELESTATSNLKRSKTEACHTLLEEIKDINLQLIDTTVDVEDDNTKSVAEGEGTIVKCTFSAVALSPNLKSQLDSAEMSPILPLRLLIPTKYPLTSPILLDKVPVETSKEPEDLSVKAKSSFSRSLRGLCQPMSLKDMAMTWDISARKVILEYAEKNGGGSFSSKYGTWKSCLTT